MGFSTTQFLALRYFLSINGPAINEPTIFNVCLKERCLLGRTEKLRIKFTAIVNYECNYDA